MKKTLLSEKPYTVTSQATNWFSMKVCLHKTCGLEVGEKVFQVRREDGVVELIPERAFNPEEYEKKT